MGERTCYMEICPECDLQVTIADETCPECGAELTIKE
jgi:rRNA maturation endonuclease Nob1